MQKIAEILHVAYGKLIFINANLCILYWNFTGSFCSHGPNLQHDIIGWGRRLALNRGQTITSNNAGKNFGSPLGASKPYWDKDMSMKLYKITGIITGPILLWFNFNPSMINNYIQYKVWDGIIYPLPNFKDAAFEVWEWISNLMLYSARCMITYPCYDQR